MIGLGSDKNTEGKIFNSTMNRKIFISDFNEAFFSFSRQAVFTVHSPESIFLSFFFRMSAAGLTNLTFLDEEEANFTMLEDFEV